MNADTTLTRRRVRVLGVPIDVLDWESAVSRLVTWAEGRQSRYVCICNVHSVVTATQESHYKSVVDAADMATPDGSPVAWTMRRKGFRHQTRINGPDLMWRLCEVAAARGLRVGFLGSTPDTRTKLEAGLRQQFPTLDVAYSFSPPFRPLDAHEDESVCQAINASGVGLLFVGLGCPKQEIWMADHRGRVQAVMLGVGAAFDYHAGVIPRAPAWMRSNGLEWLHRLLTEPRRLWRRYFYTNSVFLLKTAREALRGELAPEK